MYKYAVKPRTMVGATFLKFLSGKKDVVLRPQYLLTFINFLLLEK